MKYVREDPLKLGQGDPNGDIIMQYCYKILSLFEYELGTKVIRGRRRNKP
jgi:hypothetical protein